MDACGVLIQNDLVSEAAHLSTQILPPDPSSAIDLLDQSPDGTRSQISADASRGLKSQDSLTVLGQGNEEEDTLEIKSPGVAIPALKPRLNSCASEAQKHHSQNFIFGAAFKVAHSHIFSTFIMLVIAFNLLMMGIEVDATSALKPGEPTPAFFLVCNIAIVVIFIFELTIKFLAYGPRGVLLGPEKWWNLFDIIIVITSIIETILDMDAWNHLELQSDISTRWWYKCLMVLGWPYRWGLKSILIYIDFITRIIRGLLPTMSCSWHNYSRVSS